MAINPEVPQVACFDTAFHRGHAPHTDCYALPRAFYDEGIRRYGFHGLSYEYIAQRLPDVAPGIADGRVLVAHLGSGASMCALLGGRSLESTMGFTALDGLPMGTRPGQLDPDVVLHLIEERGMTAPEVTRLLYNDAGLKGLSGISNDMRDLPASAEPAAAFAIDHFIHRCALHAGARRRPRRPRWLRLHRGALSDKFQPVSVSARGPRPTQCRGHATRPARRRSSA